MKGVAESRLWRDCARDSCPGPEPCADIREDIRDLDTVLRKAADFTEITHNHAEGIKGGQATAAAIFLARTGQSKAEIKKFVETEFQYDLSQHVDNIRPSYKYDVSSQGTVPQAIRAFIDSTDFEDAIRTAASMAPPATRFAGFGYWLELKRQRRGPILDLAGIASAVNLIWESIGDRGDR